MPTIKPSGQLFARLPRPNEWGHYWFNGAPSCPAILKSSEAVCPGRYMAFTDDGPIVSDGQIQYFDAPEQALQALRDQCEI